MNRVLTAIAAGVIVVASGVPVMAGTINALYSTENQVGDKANGQLALKLSGETGAAFKMEGTKMVIQRAGTYNVTAVGQAGGAGTGEVFMWLRVNGKDVAHSNAMLTIPMPKFSGTLQVLAAMDLKKNDAVEVMISATAPGLGLVSVKPSNMPEVPSIILDLVEF